MEGDNRPVDVYVLEEVRDAARTRATREGQALSSIARAVLWAQANKLREGGAPPEPITLSPASESTVRFRFFVPDERYKDALAELRRHGLTVVGVVERGFSDYARGVLTL